MKKASQLVDPFLGNGASSAPPSHGLAAAWFRPKAQTGNTHPGACYPYGKLSVCAYSGAYPTGYGLNNYCSEGLPERLFDEYTALGFSHFQQSGTGAIGSYYNYLRITPVSGDLRQVGSRWVLEGESASPGKYSASLAGTGIHAEVVAARKAALHRYTFSGSGPAIIAADVSSGGLVLENMRTVATGASFQVINNSEAHGWIVMQGIRFYFYLKISAPADEAGTWTKGIPDARMEREEAGRIDASNPFGLFFRFLKGSRRVELRAGFSVSSLAEAKADVLELSGFSFDEVSEKTACVWEENLSRISVKSSFVSQDSIFRSMQYFAMIKPADFGRPFWGGEGPFFFDFATFWDMYKTHLPMMLTFYPERGRDMVEAILNAAEYFGWFPNGLLMSLDIHRFDKQAAFLAHVVVADAYVRGLKGIDWGRALRLMADSFDSCSAETLLRAGKILPYSHTIDISYAAFLTARIAADTGNEKLCKKLMKLSSCWRNVYDAKTGLLSLESPYYEGTHWNYSFRLFHDMAARIRLSGGEAQFVKTLDRFFGLGSAPCVQPQSRPSKKIISQGFALGRFEGLNNETDMETPYAYIYAGRQDRTSLIVREAMSRQFSTGRGGLPGNDDSGGLSSWYVWSAIGIFPAAGQDVYLIGSPIFEDISLKINKAVFSIKAEGNSEKAIYVQKATLNGAPLERAYLLHGELSSGGELILEMGENPSAWGCSQRPPSYSSRSFNCT